jgi:hypothetical protein
LSRGAAKRRLRVRRKRRDGSIAGDAGGEVVAEFGCCLIEAVGVVSVLAGLLLVPVWVVMS